MNKNYDAIGRYTEASQNIIELCRQGDARRTSIWDHFTEMAFYGATGPANITPGTIEVVKKELDIILDIALEVDKQRKIMKELVDAEPYLKELESKLA